MRCKVTLPILYSNKCLIQTKNSLYNFNGFNFRIESYLKSHQPTFLKYHMRNMYYVWVRMFLFIYIFIYIIFPVIFPRCRIVFWWVSVFLSPYNMRLTWCTFTTSSTGYIANQLCLSNWNAVKKRRIGFEHNTFGTENKNNKNCIFHWIHQRQSIPNILLNFTFSPQLCGPNKLSRVLLYFQHIKWRHKNHNDLNTYASNCWHVL